MAIPKWLEGMRMMTGTQEEPGDADNPKILAMRDFIAKTFPYQEDYCNLYQHDDTPWCGLTEAACMAYAGISGPFGATDTDKWMWALSWANDPNYVRLSTPVQGCVVVMEREGGGHVTMFEEWSGSSIKCRGGNQSDAINVQTYSTDGVVGYFWPKGQPMPPQPRRNLSEGDEGEDVAELQRLLGIPDDGEFGPLTETQVKAFQKAAYITADGEVGPTTWEHLDDLEKRLEAGGTGLSDEVTQAIVEIAQESDIADYSWLNRGRPYPGYIPGVALCFAQVLVGLEEGDPACIVMAQADRDSDSDALTVYAKEFKSLGMDNSDSGVDTLRHLFALIIGLGMRESSGKYCEGRDMSASNVEADTCEAGLFQTSWDISPASSAIPPLLESYWENPVGFLETFKEGISPSTSNLDVYGSGEGARYQFLAKYCPAFHSAVTAVGLRTRCSHWGPINRKEVELKKQADDMLKDVQERVLNDDPQPEPEPEPDRPSVVVYVNPPGSVAISVVDGPPPSAVRARKRPD